MEGQRGGSTSINQGVGKDREEILDAGHGGSQR